MHDDSMHDDFNEIYTDEDGNYTVFLKEFEFVYEKPDLFSILLAKSDKELIGLHCAGIGVIPGTIIGAAIGGIIGNYVSSEIGHETIKFIYGR